MTIIKQYYVTGNTSQGYINLLHSNIQNISSVYVLHHPSQKDKTALIEELSTYFNQRYDVEVILSSFCPDALEGIIVREKSIAIITDQIATAEIKHMMPIHLEEIPKQEDQAYVKLQLEAKKKREEAYRYFSKALRIHDELEDVYIQEMDFNKADQITENLITDLLGETRKKEQVEPIYRRLFGATTGKGAINVVPEIIKNISNRVYIKGRAGTGKSVLMKKIGRACEELQLEVEWYHCSLDPDSIDMVLIPSLDFCIFDSTKPHAFSPERESDIVIDLYEQTVTAGTDERFAEVIERITNKYKLTLQEGIRNIKLAEGYQSKIEELCRRKTKDEIKEIKNKIIRKII